MGILFLLLPSLLVFPDRGVPDTDDLCNSARKYGNVVKHAEGWVFECREKALTAADVDVLQRFLRRTMGITEIVLDGTNATRELLEAALEHQKLERVSLRSCQVPSRLVLELAKCKT